MKDPVPRIACFLPTQAEFQDSFQALQARRRFEEGPWIAAAGTLHGVEAVVVRTGIGKERSLRAAERVFEGFTIAEVLLAGFAGGARADLGTTDLVACSELIDIDEVVPEKDAGSPARVRSSSLLLERARETGLIAATAPAVTVSQVVTSAGAKQALGTAYGAAVVEMEGFPVLAESQRRGIPGLMVRAVLDPMGLELPDCTRLLTPSGELRLGASMTHILEHPADALVFPKLAHRVKACRRKLNEFLKSYLSLRARELEKKQ